MKNHADQLLGIAGCAGCGAHLEAQAVGQAGVTAPVFDAVVGDGIAEPVAGFGGNGIFARMKLELRAQRNLDACHLLHQLAPVVKSARLPHQRPLGVGAQGVGPVALQGVLPRQRKLAAELSIERCRAFVGRLQRQRAPAIAAAPAQRAVAVHEPQGGLERACMRFGQGQAKDGGVACLDGRSFFL